MPGGTLPPIPAAGALGGTRTPSLLTRRYPYGHPDPFRSVRDLGRAAARCSGESEELEDRSFVWLPGGLGIWHPGALVVVIASAAALARRPYYWPPQTPPRDPTASRPYGRRVLSRVGGADHAVTPEAPWTGSGCRETLLRRVRGRTTHTSTCISALLSSLHTAPLAHACTKSSRSSRQRLQQRSISVMMC
jgi:hypothetical protein